MGKPNDGGPAFPVKVWRLTKDGQTDEPLGHQGLSLRDYFAAAALTGLQHPHYEMDDAQLAKVAYDAADAMLAEREKEKP